MRYKSLALGILATLIAFGQDPAPRRAGENREGARRWILILQEEPLARQVKSRAELRSAAARAAGQRILEAQSLVRLEAARRGLRTLGSTQTVLNAVFVQATAEQAVELQGLAGVRLVVPSEPVKRAGNRALELIGAAQAWDTAGGMQNAGAGTKIGIIDTGIDQNHAAFQDDSLGDPAGGRLGDQGYTNKKVIAARSYVRMLATPESPEWSRPDDLSPRDRVGHGTAVAMLAAGVVHDSPLGKLSGVAPKAWLGSYKVFGSPGVNDVTWTDVIAKALDDALLDGMDVVTLSLAFPAVFGPADVAPNDCSGLANGTPCDPRVAVVKNSSRLGMAVVVAAGNDGDLALYLPAQNSIGSPGTTPEAITVGASTNSHQLSQTARVEGDGVPDSLKTINAMFGDGPKPAGPMTLPIVDVRSLGDNGQACSPLARGSLAGSIALVQANGCTLRVKVKSAQDAGASAVLFVRPDGRDFVYAPSGLMYTGIPLMLIGSTDGKALNDFLTATPGRQVTLDPAVREVMAQNQADFVAYFSSYGPSIGTSAIKPDLVAPGSNLFVATQNFDPASDMYDASGYMSIQGTSFSVGLVAGTVALSRQLFPDLPGFSPADRPGILKSSVVNTATDLVSDIDSQGNIIDASVTGMGAGRLYAPGAVSTPITASPATLNFGLLNASTFPQNQSLIVRNHGSKDLSITLSVRRYTKDGNGQLTITPSSFTLRAGATSQPIQVRLDGTAPAPGSYEGRIAISTGSFEIDVPFLYLATDGIPYNLVPVRNFDFVGQSGQLLSGGLLFKVVDRYGVPVPNVPVTWTYASGGGKITGVYADKNGRAITDVLGIAEAYEVTLGNTLGPQVIEASVPNLPTLQFIGTARLQPAIANGGIVNAASGQLAPATGLAPGSIISITGRGLSEFTLTAPGPGLPMSLGGISVSFDDKASGTSVPGRLLSVSDGRVDVQLPWELDGLASVKTKVSVDGFTSTDLATVPLANYSPAFWTRQDPDTGQVWVKAMDEAGNLVGASNKAVKGGLIRLYANGLGMVDPTPGSGDPASAELPVTPRGSINVQIAGRDIAVESTRLLPGSVGVYEVSVRLPADLAGGSQVAVISAGGILSPEARLPIQD